MSPALPPLSAFPGTLILDTIQNLASVLTTGGQFLLMLDPNQTLAFSVNGVTAAFKHYATLSQGQSGILQINPQGILVNGVLHVVIP